MDLIKYLTRVQAVEDTKYDDSMVPVLETALFFDEIAYITFSEYFKRDDEQLADMILAYVNAVSKTHKRGCCYC